MRIKSKLDGLQNIKHLLDAELQDNEVLGKQTYNLVTKLCTAREQEKYSFFVHDVDNIINLTLSISSRLCRVENAIQMLPADASTQEKVRIPASYRELICLQIKTCMARIS